MRHATPCRGRGRELSSLLAGCRQDAYIRRNPKATRSYPRKKHQKPPGPPKIKPPTDKQIQQAQQLTPQTIAA